MLDIMEQLNVVELLNINALLGIAKLNITKLIDTRDY